MIRYVSVDFIGLPTVAQAVVDHLMETFQGVLGINADHINLNFFTLSPAKKGRVQARCDIVCGPAVDLEVLEALTKAIEGDILMLFPETKSATCYNRTIQRGPAALRHWNGAEHISENDADDIDLLTTG